uniref:Uncharacterized protein n=1 Tax=Sphaerodactylus townsendi TaxID=933632 RepID=A0ACB8E596_9SAUR
MGGFGPQAGAFPAAFKLPAPPPAQRLARGVQGPPAASPPEAGPPSSISFQVSQYISRAEQLKVLVASSNKVLLQQGHPQKGGHPKRDVEEQASSLRSVGSGGGGCGEAASCVGHVPPALCFWQKRFCSRMRRNFSLSPFQEEEGGDDGDTLELYQQGLGELLLMLAAEPAGRRRELLHAEVQTLMGRAEYLKEQIKMKESRLEAEAIGKDELPDSVRSCQPRFAEGTVGPNWSSRSPRGSRPCLAHLSPAPTEHGSRSWEEVAGAICFVSALPARAFY